MKIKSLHIYPIKSLGGIEVTSVQVTERGLEDDRRWVLADANGRFITQREHHALALVKVAITDDALLVSHPAIAEGLAIAKHPQTTEKQEITVWDDVVTCISVASEADAWFSALLGQDVKLFYQPDEAIRLVDQNYATAQDHTSLSDGFPVLVISEASIEHLNTQIEDGTVVDLARFRPNIVLEDATPHEEDSLANFTVGSTRFEGAKPCARCVMTTIDPATAKTGKEPLKTLSQYRKWNNKILFGENLLVKQTGTIAVGDELTNIDRKATKI